MSNGYAGGWCVRHLPAETDPEAIARHLIDRGRQNHHHRGELQRDHACEQGRRRKQKRQRRAAARAASE